MQHCIVDYGMVVFVFWRQHEDSHSLQLLRHTFEEKTKQFKLYKTIDY